MKSVQTKRKFYNEWLYKLTVASNNASIFRRNTVETIQHDLRFSLESRELASALEDIKDYRLRIENRYIDIYLNDRDHVDRLMYLCGSTVKHICYPHPNLLSENIGAKQIIANRLPHGRYRFKVYLKPHTMKDQQEKKEYLQWLESQKPRIHLSESTKEWFIKTQWNWDRRYMYVEDDQTLVLAKMRQSDALGSVYSYRLTINTL